MDVNERECSFWIEEILIIIIIIKRSEENDLKKR